ncbi:TonB box-containing protein [Dendrothele bispora CBS 962.96]|uniref:TonB box-containing protein n=1 Tax=Dendrothele bispora (strain CBS 962.96) TaxID=1314807 RepID=A0A4S8MX97_DENBC|nr:TonB box-containing protein [Dendrothele bispora CBS 962.96]
MDLFLVPDNPEHTTLVSTNGVAHYQVNTSKSRHGGQRKTRIQRPAESHEASIVADIDWGTWDVPTVVRSSLLPVNGHGCSLRISAVGMSGAGVIATDFLYKKSQFSSSRYFLGDDAKEYRWKAVKGVGIVLCNSLTNEEVARYTCALTLEGLYAGERKSRLRIQPCSVDIDLVVLSFLMVEKKRREKSGESSAMMIYHDEDPKGDGGAEVDGGGS